jgi:hypothetical protein
MKTNETIIVLLVLIIMFAAGLLIGKNRGQESTREKHDTAICLQCHRRGK